MGEAGILDPGSVALGVGGPIRKSARVDDCEERVVEGDELRWRGAVARRPPGVLAERRDEERILEKTLASDEADQCVSVMRSKRPARLSREPAASRSAEDPVATT
jgi:hypothetical protein